MSLKESESVSQSQTSAMYTKVQNSEFCYVQNSLSHHYGNRLVSFNGFRKISHVNVPLAAVFEQCEPISLFMSYSPPTAAQDLRMKF